MTMTDLIWYSADERRVGLCPLDGLTVRVSVAGTMAAVDAALSGILAVPGLTAVSTIDWDSLGDPLLDDPTVASVLMARRPTAATPPAGWRARGGDCDGGQDLANLLQ